MNNSIEVDTIVIDEKKYVILDEITENNTYIYLTDLSDETDFLIQKLDDTKENLISLDSPQEFDKALFLYMNKQIKNA